jgi:hypothetical protein
MKQAVTPAPIVIGVVPLASGFVRDASMRNELLLPKADR